MFEKTTTNKPIRKVRKVPPWVDKYRPSKLSDMVAQEDVVKLLKNVIQTGNMPHLLFHGPPGTGKTSSILAMAMELFGPTVYFDRVIELNASDERGINIVRNKIVNLAKASIGYADPKYPSPPFKIIVLDEADAMTHEAQSALRKIMEDHSKITRFCFICNYINQIIDPINSRCVKFRFKPVGESNMIEKLNFIATAEKMTITDNAINALVSVSNGDMRKAIMILQNLNYLKKEINETDVIQTACVCEPQFVTNILSQCIDPTTSVLQLIKLSTSIINDGVLITDLLEKIMEQTIANNNFNDIQKSKICLHISEVESHLMDGADEQLQLATVLLNIKRIVNEK